MKLTSVILAVVAIAACQPQDPSPPTMTLLVDGGYLWEQADDGLVEITYDLRNLTTTDLEYTVAFAVTLSDGASERFVTPTHRLVPAVTETFVLSCDVLGREAVAVSLTQ